LSDKLCVVVGCVSQLFYPAAVEVNNVDEERNIVEQLKPRQDDDDDDDVDSLTSNYHLKFP